MRLFTCQHCGAQLYFENRFCQSCNHWLGYLPETSTLTALIPADDGGAPGVWTPLAAPHLRVRFCDNALYDACNWLVPEAAAGSYCAACRFNEIVPDLADATNLARWRRIEAAKHWLIYTLDRLRLPQPDRTQDPENGLAFRFLASLPGEPPPITGHASGIVTLNVEEAEDVIRERNRAAFGEPYRTLLGHFRHEIGHFYWNLLVMRDEAMLAAFRAMFGDERQNYAASLERHYAEGAAPDWRERYISAYASAHPWEDFAESFSHYLHLVDTIETASAYGLDLCPKGETASPARDFNPYDNHPINDIVSVWLPLSFAMNSLARSMGHHDLYPFVLSPPVIQKLGFINDLVARRRIALTALGLEPAP